MSTEGSARAIIAALAANLGIAATKLIAWALTGASSMLAESIHSIADSGNQALLLLGSRRARRAPTDQHQFGFGRERYIYAFIVSIVLFTVGGLFALYEAYHKWHEVHEGHENELLTSQWKWVPIVVLLAAIAMESYSFRTAIVESNHIRGRVGWVQFVRRARAPELPVVLLEDFAALIGLMLAMFGVGMTLLTHNGYWDVVGTAGIGVLLVLVAIVLAVETKSLLLGESALDEQEALIEETLRDSPGIGEVLNMRTLHVGPEELLIAVKIAVTDTESAADVARAINAAEERIRAAIPGARYIFIEPDIKHLA
ncbi:MAG TPA: cation diffusion facilitator family transporter [Nocardioidaceae bacterium]|nr:cation diffusion facilitator family transporter [Nocardioidaceae bacterium]